MVVTRVKWNGIVKANILNELDGHKEVRVKEEQNFTARQKCRKMRRKNGQHWAARNTEVNKKSVLYDNNYYE